MTQMYVRGGVYFGTTDQMMDLIEELVMDVAADLYDNVPAHKIDQRIGDVMKQLDEEGEDQ